MSEMRSLGIKIALIFSVFSIGISIYFLFQQMTDIGITWDEYSDLIISLDYFKNKSFLTNIFLPSQGRLNFFIGALGLAFFGESLFGFKIIFIFLGLLGVIYFFFRVQEITSRSVAVIFSALLISNPYFMGSARTGATAGDILSVVLWIILLGWITKETKDGKSRSMNFFSALIAGMAIGAKLTNIILIIVPWVDLFLRHEIHKKNIFSFIKKYFKFVSLAVFFGFLAHPILFLGPKMWHSIWMDGQVWELQEQYFLLQNWYQKTPWQYLAAILVTKFSPSFILLFLIYILMVISQKIKLQKMHSLAGVSLFASALVSIFFFKKFQNAYYYVVWLGPFYYFTAIMLSEVHKKNNSSWLKHVSVFLIICTLIYQIKSIFNLAPDYLQYGREWGDQFQGEFSGPAVNHCQGGPLLIKELNKIKEVNSFSTAEVAIDCLFPVLYAANMRTEKPQFEFKNLNFGVDKNAEVIVVSRGLLYSAKSPREEIMRQQMLEKIRQQCLKHDWNYPMFEIYICRG